MCYLVRCCGSLVVEGFGTNDSDTDVVVVCWW